MRTVIVHRKDQTNTGDITSSPKLYYDWLNDADEIDILHVMSHDLTDCNVIVGGGGLLHPPFEPFLQYILESDTNALVLWGIGRNAHDVQDATIMPECGKDLIAKADLVGLRDSSVDEDWVPCPSVNHQIFKISSFIKPSEKKVVLLHTQRDLEVWVKPYRNLHMRMDQPIEAVLDFILKAETVVSSSYHGCLWANWLQREVIVANSFSQKFVWGLGSSFDEALSRSEQFADEVKSLLYPPQYYGH